MFTTNVWKGFSVLFIWIASTRTAFLFYCLVFFPSRRKVVERCASKISRWSFSSLTAGLPNAYTKFLIPRCHSPIPYFPRRFPGVAVQRSHTHTGRPKRQTADRRQYNSTWPWARYKHWCFFRGTCQKKKKNVQLLKSASAHWCQPENSPFGFLSIIFDLCTKRYAWKVLASLNPLMSEYINSCLKIYI